MCYALQRFKRQVIVVKMIGTTTTTRWYQYTSFHENHFLLRLRQNFGWVLVIFLANKTSTRKVDKPEWSPILKNTDSPMRCWCTFEWNFDCTNFIFSLNTLFFMINFLDIEKHSNKSRDMEERWYQWIRIRTPTDEFVEITSSFLEPIIVLRSTFSTSHVRLDHFLQSSSWQEETKQVVAASMEWTAIDRFFTSNTCNPVCSRHW